MRRSAELLALAAGLLLAGCAPRATPPAPGPAPGPGAAPPVAVSPDLPRREPGVKVGLLVDTARVELASPGGLELARLGGQTLARVPAGQPVTVTHADGQLRYAFGSTTGTTPDSLLVARAAGDATVSIGGKPYRGAALVRRAGPGRVTAINQVDMENYLLGVVPYELGRVGEELLEAAKAQAVAARTYAIAYLGRRAALGFDVYATVSDQVYGGAAGEHEPVSRAVRETAGEILVWQGEPIIAYYHSTCAGQTAAIDEVWPQERPVPYLVSVVDVDPRTGESFDRASSRYLWTQRWSADSLTAILDRTLADSVPMGGGATTRARGGIGEIRDVQVLEKTPSGRVRRLRISTTAGDYTVGGDRVRWVLEVRPGLILNSSKFDTRVERDAQGRVTAVVAEGGGWGHGIGMCQVGAMGRARAGQDYRTILGAYYPAARIADLY